MERLKAERFLAALPKLRTLVIGDMMLDEYIWGRSERISPEAPVQVVDVTREDLRLGGAGNVVHNLRRLGCKVEVATVLGADRDGEQLQQQLAALACGVSGVLLSEKRTTTRKTRILASNQQMLRIDRESRTPLAVEDEERLFAAVATRLVDCDVILLSDYQKGVLTPTLLARLIALARDKKIPVVVDPKGDDFTKYRGATLLTPNRKEAQLAGRTTFVDEESLRRGGHDLCRELELEALVLTRSEEGMSLFFASGDEAHLPTEAREVFDVSGAGDTVLAMLGAGLGSGLKLSEAAELANLAAGIVVAKVGTSTVTAEEILIALGRQHPDSDAKILTLERLVPRLAQERASGKKIVFTNGCFDLIHVGHVTYLQQARRLGDLMVLGLNSDASIRRLKGELRPLIGETERAHILAALDCIDYVVLFDEDTPQQLIEAVEPQILVKGGDYTPETVVGREFVESRGGRVELIPVVAGRSTTALVEKILAAYGTPE